MKPISIRLGNVLVSVKSGDYVQYNGYVYFFIAGDSRNLKPKNKVKCSSILLTKKEHDKVLKLISKARDNDVSYHSGLTITKYIF